MTPTTTPLATRGIGEAAFAESLPDAIVAVFWALTHLGNPYLLLACVALAYLLGDRVGIPRRGAAFALALGLCAIGLTIGLKHFFGLPRPPISYRDGLGFPSGHALGSTMFWGGVAVLATWGRWRQRLTVAGVVVGAVALSRVLIGVHYLADVVAGVAIGVAFLAAAFALGPGFSPKSPSGALATPEHRHVTALFVLAVALGLAGLLVAPGESELFLGIGTAAGGVLAWQRFGRRAAAVTVELSTRTFALGGGGLLVALGVMSGTAKLIENGPLIAVAGAVGAVGLLALPLVVDARDVA
ncbi:phosphatase PAP2 family protein [Halobellus sp. H-GB7]|uniref:phosphatase PAP2 family protein n=1 Tax=Halobellus sp. H-GB7 TaxID=3069756 RepID=UPI0027AE6A82|nr:phosphatase PAP2 family protein [Halobellus sp. H-GB7]MDQ2056005.1 phosphatase PAP2 family protein [Halobellus sp. H-GB7]